MITLGFESTAKIASVAITNDKKVLASYSVDNGATQSELLLPMAESLLRSLNLSFSDVEILTCSVGPGSFTGVRIGVSLVKGIAFKRNIPTIGVSSLEALAENLRGLKGIIVPCMDARRMQVYTALFECDGEKITRLCEDMAISTDELQSRLSSYEERSIYIVGDGYDLVHRELSGKVSLENTPKDLRLQKAESVCRVAVDKYLDGIRENDLEIAPTYLRMPQAERERKERENTK